jgi:hypothetical protein
LGERLNGIQEVVGSIPIGSTTSGIAMRKTGRGIKLRGRFLLPGVVAARP